MAQIHEMRDKIKDVRMLVNETFLVIFRKRKYKKAGIRPNIQVVPHIVPIKHDTPLPPLNPAKIGKQCPNVQPNTVSQYTGQPT